jgi:PAS domain S-box-containing protein
MNAIQDFEARLERLPLRRRFLISPLLGLVLLIAVLAALIHQFHRQNGVLTDIVQHRLAAFEHNTAVFADLSIRHIALHELFLRSGELDEEFVYVSAKTHLNAVHEAMARIEAIVRSDSRRHAADADFLALNSELLGLTDDYRRSVTTMVEMKTVNPERGAPAWANERFAAMSALFSQVLERQRRTLVAEFRGGIEESDAAISAYSAAGVGAALLLVLLSILFTRMLSRNLQAQVRTLAEMEGVGQPGAGGAREGEVVSLARAIEAFKRTQLELRLLNQELEQRVEERTRALWNEKSLLRSLIDALPDSVSVKDPQGTYLACNRAFARRLIGLRETEVVGRRAAELRPAEDLAQMRAHELQVIASGLSHMEDRRVALAAGGSLLMEVIIAPLYDYDGTIAGTIEIGHDITARHEREQALREARAAADAANRAKSVFLANMSHEIRTPMNGVLGMVEVLGHSPLSERQRDAVKTMKDSAVVLLNVIDDILDFSKIEAGRLELERTPVAVRELVEGVCGSLLPVAAAKGVDLAVFVSPRLPERLWSDPTRLRQILYNLVGNAIKFSSGLPDRRGAVRVRARLAGPQTLVVRVTDNGIGMAPETLKQLFVPFTQGEASTTRRFGGTGLGLVISRRLARLLGGDIAVRSRPGAGASFALKLPCEAVAAAVAGRATPGAAGGAAVAMPVASAAQAVSVAEARAAGRLILVAEDDEINRKVIVQQLALLGYAAELAAHGREALELWHEGRYAMLLTDLHMPEMDGYALAAAIRAEEAGCGRMPILALTANALRGEANRARAAGMDDYLTKPIALAQLKGALEKWLAPGAAPIAAQARQGLAAAEPALDLGALKGIVGEDETVLRQMLSDYLAAAARLVAELGAARAEEDARSIAFAAHKLKASSRAVGAGGLGDLCAGLESAGRAGDWEAIHRDMPRIEAALEQVRAAAAGVLSEQPVA